MDRIACGVGERGVRTVRFEFPYMRRRRETGRRTRPDPAPVLLETWREAIAAHRSTGVLAIGGKSMGGRIASMVADDERVSALVCLGYPFHPAGKPDRLRTAHLAGLSTPCLILQGSRDALGSRDEIAAYDLSSSIEVAYLEDGDHSFKPRVRSGRTLDAHLERAIEHIAGFLDQAASRSDSTSRRR